MNDRILGMDKKTFVIVLSIAGGLLFTWATAQISDMTPAIMLTLREQAALKPTLYFYRFLQLFGVIAAVYGGVHVYKYFNTK